MTSVVWMLMFLVALQGCNESATPDPGFGGAQDHDLGQDPGCSEGLNCPETDSGTGGGSDTATDTVEEVEEPLCIPECTLGERECAGASVVVCTAPRDCPRWEVQRDCPAEEVCWRGDCVAPCTDADGDGFPVACPGQREDCDDNDNTIYPGAREVCDGVDNNCNGRIDEGGVCDERCVDACGEAEIICNSEATARIRCERGVDGCLQWASPEPCSAGGRCDAGRCVAAVECIDRDGDGAGPGCSQPDCRPMDPRVFPGASELCNGIDDNCDGTADEENVCNVCLSGLIFEEIQLGAGTLYRHSCVELERFELLPELVGRIVALAQGNDSVELTLGRMNSSEVFVPEHAFNGYLQGSMVSGTVDAQVRWLQVRAPIGTNYVLSIVAERDAREDCMPDLWEPNGAPAGGTPMGALPFGVHATLCPGDLDFYMVDHKPGAVLDVTLAYPPRTTGDVRPTIWKDGVEVSLSQSGPEVGALAAGRRVHFRADEPGNYVIGVRGATATANNDYAMVVWEWFSDCEDDAADKRAGGDDTLATAAPWSVVGTGDRVLCHGDTDVISLGALNAGDPIHVELEVVSGSSDLELRVVRDNHREIVLSDDSDRAQRTLSTAAPAGGTHYVVVRGARPDVSATYRLSF